MSNTTNNNKHFIPKTQDEINDFYQQNIKLIHHVIKPYRGCEEYEDMFQEASVGFYKGITTFSASKGVKLTTYACECAKNEVKMLLRKGSAKSRTATVVSLDVRDAEGDNAEQSFLNKDLSEYDSLHAVSGSLEDVICQRDIFQRAMSIIKNDMTYEQEIVLCQYLEGIPQADTAKEINSSQANVSKILKNAICELVVMLHNRGIIE